MQISNIAKCVTIVALLLSGTSFAQVKKSSFAVEESKRRQALQADVEAWFKQNYLPKVRPVLNPIDSWGVSVTEPRNVLPPDLGGPLNYTQITVEARINGWNYSDFRRHGAFSSFPDRGWVQCRLQQKLWAHINAQGMPTKLMKNQAASSLVACGSSGFFPPEYHGIQRPRF